MPTTIGVNENNDIYLGSDGNLVIKSGIEAISDICLNNTKAQRGEMVLAINQGIPNFQSVWVGNPNIPQFEAALRDTILNISGVIRIVELTTNISNGNLNYSVTILTQFGNTVINGNFSL